MIHKETSAVLYYCIIIISWFVLISRTNEIGLWSVGSGWVGGHHKLVSVLRSLSTVPLDVPLFKEPVHPLDDSMAINDGDTIWHAH